MDDAQPVLTVASALELEVLSVGLPEVAAGEAALSHPIRWVHTAEVPNIAGLLRGGELLLMTGVRLPDSDAGLARFISELAERRLAGLVIELGAAFARIPRAMAQAADEHALPLIALHREIPFVEVTETINSLLGESELGRLRAVDRLHRELTELMIEGGGIPEVLAALAAAIGDPVVFEREDGELLYHAVHVRDSHSALAGWDAVRHGLPGAPEHVAVTLPGARASGRLLALAVDGPLPALTTAALERASRLVALSTQQSRQEEILVARARGDLLARLLEGGLSETEIARQVRAMGFPGGVAHLLPCVLAPVGARQTAQASSEAVWAMVWRDVRRELEGQAIPAIGGLTPGGRQIALVVGLAAPAQREPRADALAALFAAALRRQVGSADAGALYVGAPSRSWTGIASGLGEVMEAAEFPRRDDRPWHDATVADLDRLLWRLRDHPDVRAFVQRRLGPLIEHDEERTLKLLPTLEAYLTHQGHKADTARALHLERQSVYHRIARIEALLGGSLDDEQTRLGVHLALRAARSLRRDDLD
jgi:PucR family transcriptional regulator, purine catabolism regulatory protein